MVNTSAIFVLFVRMQVNVPVKSIFHILNYFLRVVKIMVLSSYFTPTHPEIDIDI